jgi:hypothetical protein
MIDLNKKYKTKTSRLVKLFAIIDHKVFGAIYDSDGILHSAEWDLFGKHKAEWDLFGNHNYNNASLDLVEVLDFEIMEIKLPNTKMVKYCGIDLIINESHTFIATDKSGKIFSYDIEPELMDDNYWGIGDEGEVDYCALAQDFKGDWKKSLMEISND